MDSFGYNSPDAVNQIRKGIADTQSARLSAMSSQYDLQNQIKADQALPGILMGLGNGQQMPGGAQTPAPGQSSAPPQGGTSMAPQGMGGGQGGGPNLSVMPSMSGGGPGQAPQGAPQQGGQQPPQQGGGYDLPSVVKIIQQQYPNISGGALRNILTTINPLILTPQAKLQLEQLKVALQQQKMPIMQENADSRRGAVNTSIANSGIRYNQAYDPNGAPPPAPPAQLPMPGGAQIPTATSMGQPPQPAGMPQGAMTTIQNANRPVSGGMPQMGGPQSFNAGQGQREEAKKNADLRTQYTGSMQNDMQLSDNLTQLKTLLANPAFGTGAAGDTRAQAAGIMYYMTGDPKWNDTATVAQLDQKAMAGILVDQVANLAASGSGNRSMATDMMKRYVAQMKPEMSKTPDANRSVVEGATATLERNSLMKRFFNDVTQRAGIYPQQASQAVLNADRMYPLLTVNPNGSLQVNKDNIPKFSEALSRVSGNDYTSFSLNNGQDNQDRPLTSQEMEEYNRLLAAQGGK